MLDDVSRMVAADPLRMLDRIKEFPEQCRLAWDASGKVPLPAGYGEVDHVAVFGMGGSAIGADLVRSLTEGDARVPIVVVRDYQPPFWVGPRTLAVAASHSGSTEETVTSIQRAVAAGARPLAITSGGQVASIVRNTGGPVVPVDYPFQPRAALAHLFLPLLRTLGRLGIVQDRGNDLAGALKDLVALRDRLLPSVVESENEAKQLARWIAGGLPAFVGGGHLTPVAVRCKGQINENSKNWAIAEALPEMNHNVVVGFGLSPEIARLVRVVLLDSSQVPERIRRRTTVTAELLDRAGVAQRIVGAPGRSQLADQLYLVHLGDWVSFYLAMLNDADPTPVEPIDRLKMALANG